MSQELIAILAFIFAVAVLPLLVFAGALIWGGVSDAFENRHRRKLELIQAEAEARKEVERVWDEQFKGLS